MLVASELKSDVSTIFTIWALWLGYLDSDQGNDGAKTRCLTAWLYPNSNRGLFLHVFYICGANNFATSLNESTH